MLHAIDKLRNDFSPPPHACTWLGEGIYRVVGDGISKINNTKPGVKGNEETRGTRHDRQIIRRAPQFVDLGLHLMGQGGEGCLI